MLNLRKRIKFKLDHEEEEEENSCKTIKKPRLKYNKEYLLQNLPIELLFCIFEHLSLKDLLILRQVNNYFKYLIDECSILWANISLRLCDNSFKNDINKFIHFFRSKPRLNYIRLEFPKTMPKSLYKSCMKIDNNHIKPAKYKTYCLSINKLNILSMSSLNYFACDCTSMIINSFVLDKSSEIKNKNYNYFTSKLINKFPKLGSLAIFCLTVDSDIDQYIWNNVFKENMIISNMGSLFENLTQLSLHYYLDSAKLLIESLIQVKNLKYFQMVKSCLKDDLNSPDYFLEENKLALESLEFKSTSVSTAFFVLKYLIKYETINYLELYVKKFHINKSNSDKFYMRDLFSIYLNKLINLDLFSTNLLQCQTTDTTSSYQKSKLYFKELNISNETLSKSIKSIDSSLYKQASYKFNLSDFDRYLSKFEFSCLTKIKIKIKLNCSLDFYDEINHFLKSILNNKISSLKTIEINFKCENCNVKSSSSIKNSCILNDLDNKFKFDMIDENILRNFFLFWSNFKFIFKIKVF